MQPDDVVQYLANAIFVAGADGLLTPTEESALARVAAEIGAKKRDIQNARKQAAVAGFRPQPKGRYSWQIGNLEDMIFLALADGEVQGSERPAIVAFAQEMGLTQAQVDRITEETASRAKTQSGGIACPSCGAQSQPGAKYCVGCGTPLLAPSTATPTSLAFGYPSSGVAIEFAESTAASFPSGLVEAQAAPVFQESAREKKRRYLAAWPSGKVGDSLPLVKCLGGMRNRKVYVDGQEQLWDEVFGFLWCLERRTAAYRAAEYCFGAEEKRPNLWGCNQLSMEWTEWAEWFSYGRFLTTDVFCFDKERIAHELNRHLHTVRYCPCIRSPLIDAVLRHLPDKVKVAQRDGWAHKESYHQTPNSIKLVRRETYDGVTMTDGFYSDGVIPVGFAVANGILSRSLAECGINDVDVGVILP